MKRSDLFEAWAPPWLDWSRWAKPALFAEMPLTNLQPASPVRQIEYKHDQQTALIIDLPGAESIRLGLALLSSGLWPVPMFNCGYHSNGIVKVGEINNWLVDNVEQLKQLPANPSASPAFLLDSNRHSSKSFLTPGSFDNRWVVFPQDFPSANYLLAHQIRRVVLVQPSESARFRPDRVQRKLSLNEGDLAHVLLRWQKAGIQIFCAAPDDLNAVQPIQIPKPSLFHSLWYRALVVMGLRRSAAGGFGGLVPESHDSGSYG